MLPANVSFAAGCQQPRCQRYSRAEVEEVVRGADVVLVCLGTGKGGAEGTGAAPGGGTRGVRGFPLTPGTGIDVETEAKDRRDLELPGHQLELLQDAVRAGRALRGLGALLEAGAAGPGGGKRAPAPCSCVPSRGADVARGWW